MTAAPKPEPIETTPENESNELPSTTLKAENAKTTQYRVLAQIGFFGLFALLPLWFLLIENENLTLSLFKLTLFWLPLCFALLGILRKNAYTFAWSNFQVTLIFMHGSTAAYLDYPTPWLATIELVFCCLMLIYGSLFARHRGRELGLKVPKLKDLK